MDSSSGTIVVLSNPSLPNLLHISATTRGAEAAAKALSTNAVPSAYAIELESVATANVANVAAAVAATLIGSRVGSANSGGDFYKCTVAEATTAIDAAIAQERARTSHRTVYVNVENGVETITIVLNRSTAAQTDE